MYKKERRSWVKHLDFTILDIVCMLLSFLVAYVNRIGLRDTVMVRQYILMAGILVLIDIVVVFFSEPYKNILRRNKYQELKSAFIHCTAVFLGLIVYMFAIQRSFIFSRQIFFVYWILSFVLVFLARIILKRQVRRRIVNDRSRRVMLVVTTASQLSDCIDDLKQMEYTEFTISGLVIIDESRIGEEIRGIPVVADAGSFYEYLKGNIVDEVFINGNTIESSEALSDRLLEMGITVHYNLVHESKLMPNRVIEGFGPFMVMTSSMRIARPAELFFKRVMDIVGGIVGIVICFFIFLIFGPRIKKESPGPIFFTQTRIGKNGRKFKMYKFRSMYPDAEERKKDLMDQNEMDEIMFKMGDDPRVFPIGKKMRKYSLDEFPQFWNVLKGDMSLVGTRPPTEDEFEQYEYWHKARLGFKPGITGMWQVSGRSNVKEFEEIVALDTYYISHWNLWLDLKILFKTVQVVLGARGAK